MPSGPGSPAIDTGDPGMPQRGPARQLPGPSRRGCDIGAFELEGPTFPGHLLRRPCRPHLPRQRASDARPTRSATRRDSFFGGVPGSCGTRVRVGRRERVAHPRSSRPGSRAAGFGIRPVPGGHPGRHRADTSLEITPHPETGVRRGASDFYRSDVEGLEFGAGHGAAGAAVALGRLLPPGPRRRLRHLRPGATGGVYCSANANNSPAGANRGLCATERRRPVV